MTTEHDDPEPENDDIPPVARYYGLAVSEWVTYSFIAISVVAVIFGQVVGGERDEQAERAMATLAALTEKAENEYAATGFLVCDDRLLDPDLLANDYLSLSVKPAPIDEGDENLGYGPAIAINVVEEEVSGDTWDTAKRLMELVKEAGKEEAEALEVEGAAVVDTASEESDEEDKPKNRLRELGKKKFGEDEDYLRYSILASEIAICSQEV